MKVWELMAELSKYKACDEVTVCLPNTMFAQIDGIEQNDNGPGIMGRDVEVCDKDGIEGKLLSALVK